MRFHLCIVDVRACKALLERRDLLDQVEQLDQLVQPDLLGFVFIILTFHLSFSKKFVVEKKKITKSFIYSIARRFKWFEWCYWANWCDEKLVESTSREKNQ